MIWFKLFCLSIWVFIGTTFSSSILKSTRERGDNITLNNNDEYTETALDDGIGKGIPLDETDFAIGDTIDLSMPLENDPMEQALGAGDDLFEGDIDLNDEQKTMIETDLEEDSVLSRAVSTKRRWNKLGNIVPIPYVISSSYTFEERATIARAFNEFETKTCIRMVPRISERSYISLYRGSGCSSSVGRQGGMQKLKLGPNCVSSVGVVIHELMHAVGFWHEQSRQDRNKYIVINWDNIQSGKKRNFHRCKSCTIQNEKYDVESIMHYSKYAFSNGNGPTMRMKGCIKCELGQRKGFSALDIQGINSFYGCVP